MARRQLLDAAVDAVRFGDPIVHQRRDQRGRIDLQAVAERQRERFELGGEREPAVPARDEQRLDAERVPAKDQPAGPLVQQREGEHAAQPVEAGRAPPAPGLEQDLGVGGGPEPDPGGRQLSPQRLIVVDLAIVADDQPVLLERLVGRGRQVDDRQPAMAETDLGAVVLPLEDALGIRPAVRDRAQHARQHVIRGREVEQADYAAHRAGFSSEPVAVNLWRTAGHRDALRPGPQSIAIGARCSTISLPFLSKPRSLTLSHNSSRSCAVQYLLARSATTYVFQSKLLSASNQYRSSSVSVTTPFRPRRPRCTMVLCWTELPVAIQGPEGASTAILIDHADAIAEFAIDFDQVAIDLAHCCCFG